jgi:hypothetical protein
VIIVKVVKAAKAASLQARYEKLSQDQQEQAIRNMQMKSMSKDDLNV